MSGIYGFFKNRNNAELCGEISPMQRWCRAYGEYRQEHYKDECLEMGCCLEKLSDNAVCSAPILKREQLVAVIDAVIYNQQELSEKWKLDISLSHEEILLEVICAGGYKALREVNGDFSGAVYDKETQTLTLFRDHVGVRPLFYFASDEVVAFATDIRGVLALDAVEPSISEEWIYRTLIGSTVDDLCKTEYQHVFCVMPGSYRTYSFANSKVSTKEQIYWKLGEKKIHYSSFEEYKQRLYELVEDAVRRRLSVTTEKVGAELSGGLDSSVIDILINRLGRDAVYFAWSLTPEELPMADGDERLIIADICAQEKISCQYCHKDTSIGITSNLGKRMTELGFDLDAEVPPGTRYVFPPYVNTYKLSATCECMRENGVKVIFTGHGGDEGVSHRCNPYEIFYYREYYRFLRHIWFMTHGQKHRSIKAVKACRKVFKDVKEYFKHPLITVYATPELLKNSFSDQFKGTPLPVPHFAYSPLAYIKDGGIRNRLDNVALQGAYNGVRYVVPYLDYRVIDFAVSIPRYLYLKGDKNRYIFREAFKEIMPPSLYENRYKESTSYRNITQTSDWYESFAKNKNYTVSNLDRKKWEPYLNFEIIDEWMKQGRPSEEERRQHGNYLTNLLACLRAQHAAEQARERVK